MSLDQKTNETIVKLRNELKKCTNIEEYVDFAYSFRYEDISIIPFQIKNEIITTLKVLSQFPLKVIVEIGTGDGGTLFLLTKIANPNAKIISIDLLNGPFGGEAFPEWKGKLFEAFTTHNQKIYIIRENSHEEATLQKVKYILGDDKIDFLLIDGDHTYDGVMKDFEFYRTLVSSDGIIGFHDISRGHEVQVFRFWNEIKSKFPSIEILDNDNAHHYGIGLLFPNLTVQNEKYNKILKTIIESKNLISVQDNKQFFEPPEAMTPKTPIMNKILDEKNIELQEKKKIIEEKNIELQEKKKIIEEKENELRKIQVELNKIKKSKLYRIFFKK